MCYKFAIMLYESAEKDIDIIIKGNEYNAVDY